MGLRLRGGVWYLRKNVGGKRREVNLGYPASQRAQAEKAAVKVTNRLLDELHGLVVARVEEANPVPTLGEWWTTYKAVYSAKHVRPGREEVVVEWWLAVPRGRTTWGETTLDAFKQSDCEAALAYRRRAGVLNPRWKKRGLPLAEGTVTRERGLIQAMFERAVDDGLIDRNPWRGIDSEPSQVRTRLLTPENEVKLLASFDTMQAPPDQDWNCGKRWKRWVTFMLETGLRMDECHKLVPADVTFPNIHVHGKGRKRFSQCPKCRRVGGKCRDVRLTTAAQKALVDQWEAEGQYWPQHPSRFRNLLREACKRAKIAHISPHDLRHTFGWRYLQKGGRIHTLSKILGHSSMTVTERHYAHLLQPDIETEMLRVMEPRKLRLAASAGA